MWIRHASQTGRFGGKWQTGELYVGIFLEVRNNSEKSELIPDGPERVKIYRFKMSPRAISSLAG